MGGNYRVGVGTSLREQPVFLASEPSLPPPNSVFQMGVLDVLPRELRNFLSVDEWPHPTSAHHKTSCR